jgi:hypothetical protein
MEDGYMHRTSLFMVWCETTFLRFVIVVHAEKDRRDNDGDGDACKVKPFLIVGERRVKDLCVVLWQVGEEETDHCIIHSVSSFCLENSLLEEELEILSL